MKFYSVLNHHHYLAQRSIEANPQPTARHYLPEDEETWLNVALNKPADVIGLLHPYAAKLMQAYTVDKRLNSPTIEDPALLNSL